MIDFELLEPLKLIEPSEFAKAQLDAHGSGRFKSLSDLVAKRKKHCVWCGKALEGRRVRWCGSDCAFSAGFHCAPQSPDAKMYRLINAQQCACKRCGLDFSEEIQKRLKEKYARLNKVGASIWEGLKRRERTPEDPPEKVTYYSLGYYSGDIWQTDHIIPVHRGGKGIDPNNLQVLCVPCHKQKTKADNFRK